MVVIEVREGRNVVYWELENVTSKYSALYVSRVSEQIRVEGPGELKSKTSSEAWLDVQEIMWILDAIKTQSTARTRLRGKGRMFPPYQCAFLIKDS